MSKMIPASSAPAGLERELELLYLRRTAVDRLIRWLEAYSELARVAQSEELKKIAAPAGRRA
jgi:hypothetical protein